MEHDVTYQRRAGMIPYGRQSISESDIEAVVAALRSDFITQGPLVERFEAEFARAVGARYAVAVNSGTAALHLAMRVLAIGTRHRVITSPITFLASANAAAHVGAIPDFVDIEPHAYTLDPAALEAGWRDDIRAVVAVDYAGQPADTPEIARVAREGGAYVIEDACHGAGGGFQADGRAWKLGGHPWADITAFSFHPVKTITTGEGGMLVTDNAGWAEHARELRSHGMVRDTARFEPADGRPILEEKGPWYYEMHDLGYNYRITDMQCALGLSQLLRLDQFAARRREIVARYNAGLVGIGGLHTPELRNGADGELISWHLYTVRIDFDGLGQSRTEVMKALRDRGVGTQVLYIPVHLQPWYRRTYGYGEGKCPAAEVFYREALSLPLYAGMSESDVEHVIGAVRDVVR